jgi:hypothetical protein
MPVPGKRTGKIKRKRITLEWLLSYNPVTWLGENVKEEISLEKRENTGGFE